jgi:CHAT domain-containing protein
MAMVIPADSGLPWVQEERAYLRSLSNDQRQVLEIPSNWMDVVDRLSRGEHDGWHFSGHGQFVAPDPNRSAILLEHGQRLCAGEISGQVRNCGLAHPLMFLNACQTGREALSLTGIGGWARQFIEAEAAGFIGSLWSVYDQAAYEFARAFYGHLLAGQAIGQAVRKARQAVRPLNDTTWLAYTVFADPLATVQS